MNSDFCLPFPPKKPYSSILTIWNHWKVNNFFLDLRLAGKEYFKETIA